jgi:hypothetical protein
MFVQEKRKQYNIQKDKVCNYTCSNVPERVAAIIFVKTCGGFLIEPHLQCMFMQDRWKWSKVSGRDARKVSSVFQRINVVFVLSALR